MSAEQSGAQTGGLSGYLHRQHGLGTPDVATRKPDTSKPAAPNPKQLELLERFQVEKLLRETGKYGLSPSTLARVTTQGGYGFMIEGDIGEFGYGSLSYSGHPELKYPNKTTFPYKLSRRITVIAGMQPGAVSPDSDFCLEYNFIEINWSIKVRATRYDVYKTYENPTRSSTLGKGIVMANDQPDALKVMIGDNIAGLIRSGVLRRDKEGWWS